MNYVLIFCSGVDEQFLNFHSHVCFLRAKEEERKKKEEERKQKEEEKKLKEEERRKKEEEKRMKEEEEVCCGRI